MTNAVSLGPIWNGTQFFDANGIPLSGGKIFTYIAGSFTTPATTYQDPNGTIPNSNPIILDSSGQLLNEIWILETTAYNFVLADSAGTVLRNCDNITIATTAAIANSLNPANDYTLHSLTVTHDLSVAGTSTLTGVVTTGSTMTVGGNLTLVGNEIDFVTNGKIQSQNSSYGMFYRPSAASTSGDFVHAWADEAGAVQATLDGSGDFRSGGTITANSNLVSAGNVYSHSGDIFFDSTNSSYISTTNPSYGMIFQPKSGSSTADYVWLNDAGSGIMYLSNTGVLSGVTFPSLGVGQTWQSPSRATNTWYQNTSGNPISVSLSCECHADQTGSYFDMGVSTGSYVTMTSTTKGADFYNTGNIIPNGWYYRHRPTDGGNPPTIDAWLELR